jgi:prepilin-type N-terminal cleavage/methylation domain-containing protein
MSKRTKSVDGETAGRNAARRSSRPGHAKECGAVSRAFTLIELIVVIGIIVLLLMILLPALAKARNLTRASQTRAMLTHVSASIETYFTRFHAYPGPLSAAQTTTGAVSGSQNMMLGLSYGIVSGSGAMAIPGASVQVKSLQVTGPVDYASRRPDGSFEQLPAFFGPTAKQVFAFTSSAFRLPVPVDSFPDGLPILYYRRNVGTDNSTSGSPPGYDFNENTAYTGRGSSLTLVSSSGTAFVQNGTAGSVKSVFSAAELNKCVTIERDGSGNPSSTGPVHGGYVLISAGADRYYGTMSINGDVKPSDDLVLVGGE